MSRTWTTEEFFRTYPEPATLAEQTKKVEEFVQRHNAQGRNVALVTVRTACLPNADRVVVLQCRWRKMWYDFSTTSLLVREALPRQSTSSSMAMR